MGFHVSWGERIVCWGYIGIMEEKMETVVVYWGLSLGIQVYKEDQHCPQTLPIIYTWLFGSLVLFHIPFPQAI